MTLHPAQKYQKYNPSDDNSFWGYLLNRPLKMRYYLAAKILESFDVSHILEVGGYSDNIIANYFHNEATFSIFTLDVESVEIKSNYNSVNVIKDWIQNIDDYDIENYDTLLFLGYEMKGDDQIFLDIAKSCNVVIIEGWDNPKAKSFERMKYRLNREFSNTFSFELDFSGFDIELETTFKSPYRDFLKFEPWKNRIMYVYYR